MNYVVYIENTIYAILIITFIGIMINFVTKKKIIKPIVLKITLLISIVAFVSLLCYERFSIPILKLNGKEIVTIKLNESYKEDGYKIIHPNYRIFKDVKITSTIDNTKPGVYEIKYELNYYNKKIAKTRKIIVEDDILPVINLTGGEVILYEDEKYTEPGYTATDNYDGDITKLVKMTDNIKNEVGEYEVIYTVTDSSDNTFTTSRKVIIEEKGAGMIYLTFDDGPSGNTATILDVLKKYNVKATFFVVNFSDYYKSTIKRIVEEGHTIGLHSYTHNYKIIYSSVDAYFDDLNKLSDKIKEATGVESKIVRFPGGSSNTVSYFNKGIMSTLTKKLIEDGYHYFDWNVDARDAWDARSSTDVYNNVINTLVNNRNNVVLMHDTKGTTTNAIEDIIKTAKRKGYSFDNIDYETPMVTHGIRN